MKTGCTRCGKTDVFINRGYDLCYGCRSIKLLNMSPSERLAKIATTPDRQEFVENCVGLAFATGIGVWKYCDIQTKFFIILVFSFFTTVITDTLVCCCILGLDTKSDIVSGFFLLMVTSMIVFLTYHSFKK